MAGLASDRLKHFLTSLQELLHAIFITRSLNYLLMLPECQVSRHILFWFPISFVSWEPKRHAKHYPRNVSRSLNQTLRRVKHKTEASQQGLPSAQNILQSSYTWKPLMMEKVLWNTSWSTGHNKFKEKI